MNSTISRIIAQCRVCDCTTLAPILSLGDLYISDFCEEKSTGEAPRAPLEIVLCDSFSGGCGLLQLRHTVSHEAMYRNYWYRSGINKTMTDELCSIAQKAMGIANLRANDFVIDIGANDGTLLRGYTLDGLKTIGYEPAVNLSEYNAIGTTKIIPDFFNARAWTENFPTKKAKVITAIAMFYDLDDPIAFVKDVVMCLDDEGVFIIQMSYLPSMLLQNAFDNICHEHLEYYSLRSLEYLLNKCSLEVFDIELNDINGGSFRVYIRHVGKGKSLTVEENSIGNVERARRSEIEMGLDSIDTYRSFVDRIEVLKTKTVNFIKKETASGNRVYAYGASTKGNTLLQYYGLNKSLILAAAERNPHKWGRKTVGSEIPIISEEQARDEHPDYFLVLPWHFLPEIKKRETQFLESGGKFIIPLPEFEVLTS